MFVFLAQIDRFYSMPLLLLTLTIAAMWLPRGGVAMIVVTATAGGAHGAVAQRHGGGLRAGGAGRRAGLPGWRDRVDVCWSAAARPLWSASLLYFLYLRPIVHGWSSTGNPTPVLVSFAAHAGIPVLALAFLGGWLSRGASGPRAVDAVVGAALCAAACASFPLAPVSWNPRYFVFFMPAMWVLAAHAVEFVARSVGSRSVAAAWYACVVVLLSPNLLSHYQDGSRHDYRQAAAVLLTHARQGQPILSDDAETISYYLPDGPSPDLAGPHEGTRASA